MNVETSEEYKFTNIELCTADYGSLKMLFVIQDRYRTQTES
jgi:hypothetical protein